MLSSKSSNKLKARRRLVCVKRGKKRGVGKGGGHSRLLCGAKTSALVPTVINISLGFCTHCFPTIFQIIGNLLLLSLLEYYGCKIINILFHLKNYMYFKHTHTHTQLYAIIYISIVYVFVHTDIKIQTHKKEFICVCICICAFLTAILNE